ncbi:response regulator [Roseivirga echinicomitans]|uniref:Response regulatory domain-containing protein n=1 Tax=Roseivirga echinicomitans TaxID=296218 RepID=A0A150XU35_9BACT|nr:response regulator [Roseivirga echinicomitans]KYG82257.1 hypothetical protein AWN68_15560 [Roseivirga echinicomitans]
MEIKNTFITIDDDPVNNLLSKIIISKVIDGAVVSEFNFAQDALDFISNQAELPAKTTLLLDINMPEMSGWEFLDAFATFSQEVKDKFEIYMLSSSVDDTDINKSKAHTDVTGYISKPLTMGKLDVLFNKAKAA